MATIEVKVPAIGDYKDVPIIEVLVKAGDTVAANDPLVTLESDKATMDVPAPQGGKIRELKVKVGDRVGEGSIVAVIEGDGAAGKAGAAAQESGSARATRQEPVEGKDPAPAKGQREAEAPREAPPSTRAPGGDGQAERRERAPAATASGGSVEIKVPSIGDYEDVPIIDVLVKAGDAVKANDPLVTLESDKATMDVPAPQAGKIRELKVKVGDRVGEGSVIAVLEAAGAATAGAAGGSPVSAREAGGAGRGEESDAAKATRLEPVEGRDAAPARGAEAEPSEAERAPAAEARPSAEPQAGARAVTHASPAIRKLARELGVPIAEVQGTGPKGRVLREDVQRFVKETMSARATAPAAGGGAGPGLQLAPWPKVDFAQFGPVERKPLSRIRKLSKSYLARNWVMIPHVTQHDEADITDLEKFRVELNAEAAKDGAKVTLLAFLVKACVAALRKFPEFNASLEGDDLVVKKYFHVGFAADTPNGLVVPVIRNADQKGVLQIAKELAELAAKAREGKLAPADIQGGCFSISSLGGIGGAFFTPIINAPEVAILGASRSAMKPVWNGEAFEPRLVLPLSLSYDHRVIDGAVAARFTTFLAGVLKDMRRAML